MYEVVDVFCRIFLYFESSVVNNYMVSPLASVFRMVNTSTQVKIVSQNLVYALCLNPVVVEGWWDEVQFHF